MCTVSEKTGSWPVKPCQYFDLILGTSTGGLIALMLGWLCYTMDEAITKYTEYASRIFGNVGSNTAWATAGYPKVDGRPLEQLLTEIGRAGGKDGGFVEDSTTSTGHCRVLVQIG
jgi:hypothetical protein